MGKLIRTFACVIAFAVIVPASFGASGEVQAKSRKVDLADVVAGEYQGDVISDARGASQSHVTLSVEKVAQGTVRVTSNYKRLPEFTVKLTRAMNTIQNSSGAEVFLVDQSKSPWTLNITVDDASWAGVKE